MPPSNHPLASRPWLLAGSFFLIVTPLLAVLIGAARGLVFVAVLSLLLGLMLAALVKGLAECRFQTQMHADRVAGVIHGQSVDEGNLLYPFHDPLTHLPNRHLLLDRLQQALASSARSHRQGALLFIDLDNFKVLNDSLGHPTGDLLLQQVAQRLSDCVREGDTVARLGGDEFVVMLEALSESPEEAAEVARIVGNKVLAAIDRPYRLAGHDYVGTPSIGITLFGGRRETIDELLKREAAALAGSGSERLLAGRDRSLPDVALLGDHRETIESLLKQADLAMRQAKAAGRNRLWFFDPALQSALEIRTALEQDIRKGLQSGQFLLHYQRQVDAIGQLTGVEALLRWHHPQRGWISPTELVPQADATGLTLPLGRWVLETACVQLASWANQPDHASISMAVNIGTHQFRHPGFVDEVRAILARTGADPRRLTLELTESLLLEELPDTVAKMTALKAYGVRFTLDNFGTGYCSLSFLKRLPLDHLKIDPSFVRTVLAEGNADAGAAAFIALAQSFGLILIAEGVESEAQRDFLVRHGCRFFQGYLFGPPGPAETLI